MDVRGGASGVAVRGGTARRMDPGRAGVERESRRPPALPRFVPKKIQERRAMIPLLALATLWLPAASALRGLEAGNGATIEARRLATVPQDAKLKGLYPGPDLRRLGFIAKRGAKEFAVVDGVTRQAFDSIPSSLTFSPDSKSVAYIAREGTEQFAVINGIRGESYDFVQAPTFSPNSARFVYAASRGTRRYLVLDGAREGEYDSLTPPFLFSPDSRRLAYVAGRGGQEFVVNEGGAEQKFDLVLQPICFSPDSKRIGYVGVDGAREFAVVDGIRGNDFQRMI